MSHKNIIKVRPKDYPKILKENGYIFQIKDLKVRVGNILTCLENLLLIAKNTKSIARIRRFNDANILLLKQNSEFDFRSNNVINCNKIVTTGRNFLNKNPFHEKMFIDKDKWCLKYLRGLIKKVPLHSNINNDTLVIHIRGGDIFRKKPPHVHAHFYQPPFSFYKHIIQNSNHSDIIIISQKKYRNPMVNKLLSYYPNIRLSDGDYFSDVNIILNAVHFVSARSSFSFMLSRLSKNLKSVYFWGDDHWRWREWPPNHNNCLSDNKLSITRFSSDDYIQVGEWQNTRDQHIMMDAFPIEKIRIEQV